MAFGDKVDWNFDVTAIAPAQDLMDATQTAAFLGIETRTLYYWIEHGHMLDGVVIGGKRRWSKVALTNYIYSRFQEQQLAKK